MSYKKEVIIYRTDSDKEPFLDWLHKLKDPFIADVIMARLDRVKKGNLGDCKHLKKGVYELRVHYGKGYRVYFGQHDHIIIVLLCGGHKGTQKRDIEKVYQYWNEFKKEEKL